MNPYASIFRRAMALFLDTLVAGLIATLAAHALPVLGGVLAWFFYFPVLDSSALRGTLGKYWMGIQVVDLEQRRISFRAALLRNIVKIFSSALLCLGYLLALFTNRKQTLHDLAADTVVVYGRATQPVGRAWMDSVRSLFGALDSGTSGADALSRLERLHNLKEKGALSEREFESEKSRILGGDSPSNQVD